MSEDWGHLDEHFGIRLSNLPGLRAAGLIVAGLMVAFSAPLGWAEYIRTGDDDAMGVHVKTSNGVGSSVVGVAAAGRGRRGERAVPAERRVLI